MSLILPPNGIGMLTVKVSMASKMNDVILLLTENIFDIFEGSLFGTKGTKFDRKIQLFRAIFQQSLQHRDFFVT